jgi:hypothetical protein
MPDTIPGSNSSNPLDSSESTDLEELRDLLAADPSRIPAEGSLLDEYPDDREDESEGIEVIRVDEEPARPDDIFGTESGSDGKPGSLSLFPDMPVPQVVGVGPESGRFKAREEAFDKPERDERRAGLRDNLKRLEVLMKKEFGDTLTGTNAFTMPLGVFLLVLSIIGWLLNPLLVFLNIGQLLGRNAWIIPGSAAILTLAGIHLVFYWSVHKTSNAVKSSELDKLIMLRRVMRPCSHLDCYEAEDIPSPEEILDGEDDESASDLKWRCTLFGVELEANPICAVCDRYEQRESPVTLIRE